uniref:CHD3/4/5B n=1 Tax=Platynereis dumerilii TaxID=6359 RepID=A0A8E7MJA1_PLADU|nr:CHD3/4/5B [Platynereis dumerilii]
MLGGLRRRRGPLTEMADSESGSNRGHQEHNYANTGSVDQSEQSEAAQNLPSKQFYGSVVRPRRLVRRLVIDDEEEEEVGTRRRSQRQRKIKLLPLDFEATRAYLEEEDFVTDKAKKRRCAKSKDESGSESWSTESESESSGDENEASGRKRKKQTEGERKSARIQEGGPSKQNDITDKEFENILDREEEEIPKYKQKKPKVKKKKKKRKSGLKNVRRVAYEEEAGNREVCQVCLDGGEILLCDKCPRSFHKECAGIEEVPEGDWECPRCTGDMSDSDESDSGHEHFCRVCRDGGEVMMCDFCPFVYHMTCLNPPMTSPPLGNWKCPRCVTLEKPLKGWVQSIITWKWSENDTNYDELDHTKSPIKKKTEKLRRDLAAARKGETRQLEKQPERLIFVRFKDYSYWECDWITEQQLEVFHNMSHKHFKKKYDQDEPPALEDGSSFGSIRHNTNKNDDPHQLEDRFYKWGIKPCWLQIHRILNHDTVDDRTIFLVKWQDLGYDHATWEDPEKTKEGLEDLDKHLQEYWKRRKDRLKAEKEKGRGGLTKKSLLKEKCLVQPSYFDETGGKLHPYQLEGLNWLRFSFSQNTNTILADEMGLGKTIQAISFLNVLWKEGYAKGPFLVSAPLSTVPNWEREFQFWAPEMYVVSYSGGKDTRPIIRHNEFSYKPGAFTTKNTPGIFSKSHTPKFDVLLTSYEMVSQDKLTLASIDWDVMVIDEAHRLRSNHSLFFKTLCDYKVGYKLLLTGTPLQNNLEELFHLLNFLEPGKFDDLDNFLDLFSEISKEDQVQKLHEMLAPHMLRRMKIDVLKEIPPKSEFIVRVELSAMQKKYYKHILTKNYEALNVKGYGKQTSLINIMMDLRKCCNHPYLFPTAQKDAPLVRSGHYEIEALTKHCGKLDLLEKMLKVLKEDNHRVLVFSQMTRVLDLLEDFMFGLGYGYERIDGSVMGGTRQAAIDRFNSKESDSFVFLLSTKAGGLGINLATADTVIIFDMDWNPHNDIQAFSRAHRIGQKNKVMIYRFVSRNTVEEKMTQVCKQKMMLTELVIHRNTAGAERVDSLSKQEVNDILRFGAEELFKDSDKTKAIVYDDEAVRKLLDRSQESDKVEEQEKEFGMNEYLRSFKVASYQIKEGVEDEPAKDESNTSLRTPEKEVDYWSRVLGESYEEHRAQRLKEEEELAASLGKGKRNRRKINYAETFMTPEKKAQQMLIEAKVKSPEKVLQPQGSEHEDDDEYEPDSDSGSDYTDEEPENPLDYVEGDENDENRIRFPQPLPTGEESAESILRKLAKKKRREKKEKRKERRRRKAIKLPLSDRPWLNENIVMNKVEGTPEPECSSPYVDHSLDFLCGSSKWDSPLAGAATYDSDSSNVPIARMMDQQKPKGSNLNTTKLKVDELAFSFPHVPKKDLREKLKEYSNNYLDTYDYFMYIAPHAQRRAPALTDSPVAGCSTQKKRLLTSPSPSSSPKRIKILEEIKTATKESIKKRTTPKSAKKMLEEVDEIDQELARIENDHGDILRGMHSRELKEMDADVKETSGVLSEMASETPSVKRENEGMSTPKKSQSGSTEMEESEKKTPSTAKRDIRSYLQPLSPGSPLTSRDNIAVVKKGKPGTEEDKKENEKENEDSVDSVVSAVKKEPNPINYFPGGFSTQIKENLKVTMGPWGPCPPPWGIVPAPLGTPWSQKEKEAMAEWFQEEVVMKGTHVTIGCLRKLQGKYFCLRGRSIDDLRRKANLLKDKRRRMRKQQYLDSLTAADLPGNLSPVPNGSNAAPDKENSLSALLNDSNSSTATPTDENGATTVAHSSKATPAKENGATTVASSANSTPSDENGATTVSDSSTDTATQPSESATKCTCVMCS